MSNTKNHRGSQIVKEALINTILEHIVSEKQLAKHMMSTGFKGYSNMSFTELTDTFINMFGWEEYGNLISNLSSDNMKYIAYFDGAEYGDGEGIVSYVIKTDGNKLIVRDAINISAKSSYSCEQLALLKLLDKALELGIDKIEVFGDCQSVINKVNNRKGGKKGFNGYYPSIVNRIDKFNTISLYWNSRDNNRYADMLCRLRRKGVNITKQGGEFNLNELLNISAKIGQKAV